MGCITGVMRAASTVLDPRRKGRKSPARSSPQKNHLKHDREAQPTRPRAGGKPTVPPVGDLRPGTALPHPAYRRSGRGTRLGAPQPRSSRAHLDHPDPVPVVSRARVVARVAAAVLAGLIVLLLGGVITLIPLLLLGATAAVLLHDRRSALTIPRTQPPPPPPPPLLLLPGTSAVLPGGVDVLSLAQWSERELCHAWQRTYVQLQRHTDAAWTEHLAQTRRTYLDELQRRDPTGFAAWIASGARAASDPSRYLTTSPPRTP